MSPPTPPEKQKKQPAPPSAPAFSASFLDGTKQMRISRSIYLKVLIGGSIAIVVAMFCFFSIFWGALWKTPVRPFDGWVVDFDGSNIGSTVSQALVSSSLSSRVTWSTVPASNFPGGLDQVAERIREEDAWVAVVIHASATDTLNNAIQSVDSSYNGTNAISVYGAEARNENAYRSIISPTVQASLTAISRQFAIRHAQSLASSSSLSNIMSNAPQLITDPLSFAIVNTIPFDVPVASAITFVGLIYLLILSFFIVMMGLSAREISGLDKHLSTTSLIRLRLGSTLIAYFLISLFYSLLSRAFQVDFSRKFGAGGFVVFWMLNWCGMLSVGLALEAMITLLTVRGIPFFMLLHVISNVSVCAMPIQVLPKVFRYGYAMPFYNVSRSVRTIIFGTKNEVGLNFGVLVVHIAVSCALLSIAVVWRRKQAIKSYKENEDGGMFTQDKAVEDAEGQ